MILINGFHYNSICAVVSACICSLSYCHESLNKSIQLVTLKKILTGKLFHKISWHKIILRGKLLVLSVTLIHIHHTDKCLCLQFTWSLETLYGEFWELSYKCNILKLGYKYFTSLLRYEKSGLFVSGKLEEPEVYVKTVFHFIKRLVLSVAASISVVSRCILLLYMNVVHVAI